MKILFRAMHLVMNDAPKCRNLIATILFNIKSNNSDRFLHINY
jgi:hypothetical protein